MVVILLVIVVVVAALVLSSLSFVCSKIRDYTPSEASKVYNKPLVRKSGIKFNPHQVIDLVRLGSAPSCTTQSDKEKIVTAYIEVVVDFVLQFVHCTLLLCLLSKVCGFDSRPIPHCRWLWTSWSHKCDSVTKQYYVAKETDALCEQVIRLYSEEYW